MDYREYQPGDDLRRLDWAAWPAAQADRQAVPAGSLPALGHPAGRFAFDGPWRDAEGSGGRGAGGGVAAAADNAGYSRRVYLTGQGCRPVSQAAEPPMFWQGVELDSAEGPPAALRALPPAWRRTASGCSSATCSGWASRWNCSAVWPIGRRPCTCSRCWPRPTPTRAIGQFPAGQQRNGRIRGVVSRRHGPGPLPPQPPAALRQLAPRRRAGRGLFVPLVAERLVADWDLSALLEAEILTV